MEDFEVNSAGSKKQNNKYWESQWLIGYLSDSKAGQWWHDKAVEARREG